jgi:hypothetical protein
MLSGRGVCDELITHLEESYRLWCDVVCGLETAKIRMAWPALGPRAAGKKMSNVKRDEEYGKIPQTSSRKPLCRVSDVFVVISMSFTLGN